MAIGPRKVHLDRGNGTPWCFVKGKVLALGNESEANCEICFKRRETSPGPNQKIVCSKCKSKKPAAAFYGNAARETGKNSYCIECFTASRKVWRVNNRPAYAAKTRREYKRHPERFLAAAKRNRETKPKAAYARQVIRNELKSQRMQRLRCEDCGATYTHGHHDDYDKPLEVRWLCPVHHREWHDANGPGANIEGEPVFVERSNRRSA